MPDFIDRETIKEIVRKALSEAICADQRHPASYLAPWTGVEYETHASRRQFNIDEAAVRIGELLEFAEAQRCSIEKDKPCDHCGICRNLGF